MMITYVSVLRPYSLQQCYKWYKSLLIYRSGYLRMSVIIRFSTLLNGDSLSDRYDLRMPIYGCAQTPIVISFVKVGRTRKNNNNKE